MTIAMKTACPIQDLPSNILKVLDGDSNMPFHGAIQFGNFAAAKVCLESGSSIDETDNKYNNSAVHMAATLGSIELLYLFKQAQPKLFEDLVTWFSARLLPELSLTFLHLIHSFRLGIPLVKRLYTRQPYRTIFP